jgi:uncharacterized repeat protein (TIGR03803 family)
MNLGSVPKCKKSSCLAETVAAAFALAMVFALAIVATPAVQAQTYKVIYNFTGGADGGSPWAGLTIDAAGDLYGTTIGGGAGNSGTVFELTDSGSGWSLATLYSFQGGDDGAGPQGRVAIAQDGSLYGTTAGAGFGCTFHGCGTVFHLTPPQADAASVPWNETVLHRFTGTIDGGNPQGDLTFDAAGNIYGTTMFGGCLPSFCGWEYGGYGVVYKLTTSAAGWTETVLHAFQWNEDGGYPLGGVVFDGAGNLYGVVEGGHPYGLVYQLSPSGSGWTKQTLYEFPGGGHGADPYGGLIRDPSGNLYGTTQYSAPYGTGTIFELTPSNGGWAFNTLYVLPPCGFLVSSYCGEGPMDKLMMDAAGNLYGTTREGGAIAYGSVFKLTPSNGGWTYTTLHDFNGDDGRVPVSSLVFDANGNLYGTTAAGGSGGDCPAWGCGVVFEITP